MTSQGKVAKGSRAERGSPALPVRVADGEDEARRGQALEDGFDVLATGAGKASGDRLGVDCRERLPLKEPSYGDDPLRERLRPG